LLKKYFLIQRFRVFSFFSFFGDGDSGAPGMMAKDCRLGDGESLRQAFAISVLTCCLFDRPGALPFCQIGRDHVPTRIICRI
jgi:hypothetical protein